MTKLHHTKWKKNYRDYVLSTIETGLNEEPLTSVKDKARYIKARFKSESSLADPHGPARITAMSEWLQGMALDIDYLSCDILDRAVALGSLQEDYSEALKHRVLDKYWDFMGLVVLALIDDEAA